VSFNIGDTVGYKSYLDAPEFTAVGKVREIWPDGIPSCREPMLLIDGKAGCVLQSHCTRLIP